MAMIWYEQCHALSFPQTVSFMNAKTLCFKTISQWNFIVISMFGGKCNLSIEANLRLGGIRLNCTYRILSDLITIKMITKFMMRTS